MITSVFQAIIDKLANDSTLTSYIGPEEYIGQG